MEDDNILFCSSKFPWARERIFSKFIHNLGTRPHSFASPSLDGAELTRRPIDARSSVANELNNSALTRTRSLLYALAMTLTINSDYFSVSANSIGHCNDDQMPSLRDRK